VPAPRWRGADPLPGLIDSSFLRLYTGPPKPPVVGDLAGSERGFGASSPAPRRSAGTGSSSSGNCEGADSPGIFPFPVHRGSAASLRNMMGVFPLPDTMRSVSPSSPRGAGNAHVRTNGWTAEVWWSHDPMPRSRHSAAPAHYSARPHHSTVTRRAPPTDPACVGVRTSGRIPAVSVVAAGNRLQ
jgi:hypothetical protein